MEQMHWHPYPVTVSHKVFPPMGDTGAADLIASDWHRSLPALHGRVVTLRQLRQSDAPSLLALLTTEEVSRFISPPPTTLDAMEAFITWTHTRQREGRYACFAVVPEGTDTAVGIFQVRALDHEFETAEWGFALGSPYWGSGLFAGGAALMLQFVFETIGVRRLEARSSLENGRGNGALQKVGAVREGTLRQSFVNHGRCHDQNLWVLLESDWKTVGGGDVTRAPSDVGDDASDRRSPSRTHVH
jgi:RimJ/RimL family protein N-acetyltransferase